MARHRIATQSQVSFMTRWPRYSATLTLFVIPGPIVAMLAAVLRLTPKHFYAVMLPSQILWMVACFYLGAELEFYLDRVKFFVIEHCSVRAMEFDNVFHLL